MNSEKTINEQYRELTDKLNAEARLCAEFLLDGNVHIARDFAYEYDRLQAERERLL